MVSELAAWLHRNEWPVEMVAASSSPHPGDQDVARTSHAIGAPSAAASGASGGLEHSSDQAPDVVAMGYRMRRLSPWLVHTFELEDARAADVAKAPFVVSLHSVPEGGAGTGRSVANQKLEEQLGSARRVICTSRVAAHRLRDAFGYESVVVPDGVDTELLDAIPTRRSRPLVVCPMGEVSDRDLSMLVDAFVLVGSSVPDLQLAITGTVCPSTHAELVEKIPRALKSQLLVLDRADRKRRLSLYGRASATCMPSVSDGSTRTLVESLAVGTPVVCADGGTAAELVDEDAVAAGAGLRFAVGDTEACANAIERTLEQAPLDEAGGVRDGCRAMAKLYDWSFVGPRLVELYRQAAA